MTTTLVRVDHVTKVYGKKVILNDVQLDVQRKDIFGIIGSSGSGKSTLLRLIIGIEKSEEGQILLQPTQFLDANQERFIPVVKNQLSVRRMMGFATQSLSFYPKLTVRENLEYFASLYGLSKSDVVTNVNTLLQLLGLEDSREQRAENLSGGMQKRLDIGCALIHDPQILILDEPTADLDPILRKHMWDLIRRINKRGTTIIIASHFLDEIEAICNNIAILHNHKIQHTGTPKQIKKMYSENDRIHLESIPGNYDKIKESLMKAMKKNIHSIERDEARLHIKTPHAEKVLRELLIILNKRKEEIVDLYVAKPNLNEVFEALKKARS